MSDTTRKGRIILKRYLLTLLNLAWLGGVGFGLSKIWRYEAEPGPAVSAMIDWPAASAVPRLSNRPTLLMFAHPQCPCTRASIGELARLMAHCRNPISAYVLFYKPWNAPGDWEKTGLYFQAAAIPGVHVLPDPEGREAKRFHAVTSGQALLYDAAGRLLFHGGITGVRGHAGDNAGEDTLTALIAGKKPERAGSPVFGCSLRGGTIK